MKVRCIQDAPGISLGGIYEVIGKTSVATDHIFCIEMDNGIPRWYYSYHFEVVQDDLSSGWKYCKCGATTINKNGICCGCKFV